jgi:hypothetical protein
VPRDGLERDRENVLAVLKMHGIHSFPDDKDASMTVLTNGRDVMLTFRLGRIVGGQMISRLADVFGIPLDHFYRPPEDV